MLRTWQIEIRDKGLLKLLKPISHKVKNLYNTAIFIQKGLMKEGKRPLFYEELDEQLKDYKNYRSLQAQTAQQVLKEVGEAFESYYAQWQAFREKTIKDKPSPPNFKDIGEDRGFKTITFTNQQIHFVEIGKRKFIRLPIPKETKTPEIPFIMVPINDKIFKLEDNVREIKLIPDRSGRFFTLHLTFKIDDQKVKFKGKKNPINLEKTEVPQNFKNILSIDLGLKRIITATDLKNNKSFKVDASKIVKINEDFNEKRAIDQSKRVKHFQEKEDRNYNTKIKRLDSSIKRAVKKNNKELELKRRREKKILQQEWNSRKFGDSKKMRKDILKRNHQLHDELHKLAKDIICYCLTNRVNLITVGYNEGWKQEVAMGKDTNRKFVQIPYSMLVKYLQEKGALVGIHVELVNEAYTSKCDALALEELPLEYLPEGVKVGLDLGVRQGDSFKSSTGKTLHSDVNGNLNIFRKWGLINKVNLDPYLRKKFKCSKFLGCVSHPGELSSLNVQRYQLV